MTLPADACPVKTGSLMELYTPEGSAGIFRVQQLTRRSDALVTLQLEHSLVTLSDSLASAVPDMTGTAQAVLEALLSCQSTILWRPGAVEVPPDVTLTWKRSPSMYTRVHSPLRSSSTVMPHRLRLRRHSHMS